MGRGAVVIVTTRQRPTLTVRRVELGTGFGTNGNEMSRALECECRWLICGFGWQEANNFILLDLCGERAAFGVQ